MSEWAYRNCKCGNRVHINFTCDKCNGDPWNERTKIINKINNLKSKRSELILEIKNILKQINLQNEQLCSTYYDL